MIKILLIEDEPSIADLVQVGLTRAGYQCDYALDGEAGADLIEQGCYDLILLDIMLPKISGYELMEYIAPLNIPVIFLTAKDTTANKIKGLRMGADDYIAKPFEIEEVIARIEVVLRRFGKNMSVINILDIEIHTNARRVIQNQDNTTFLMQPEYKKQTIIALTPKEYDLLLDLVCNKNKVMYREDLFEKVWETEFIGDTRTLDLHVQRLRKKLSWKDRIKTVFGYGYILEVLP
jgi:DNA-binding response OmpR family regulator